MPADVIIDPSTGQIYWNDGTGTPQSISIKGDALDAISFVGYSGSFSPGSTPGGLSTIATFKDSATATLAPGTTGNELGSTTLRWKMYGTSGNFSDTTNVISLLSNAVVINGGIAISGNASIGQTLFLYGVGTASTSYTGIKAGSVTTNTLYTLPTSYPATGTSVLQSDTVGTMSWAQPATVNSGALNYAAYYGANGTAISQNANLIFTGTGLSVGGLIQSTSTSTGSLFVLGGVGITGNAFIGGTTSITSNTAAISSNSGALVVTGGFGLGGNAFIGGTVYVPSTTASNFSNLLVSNTTATTSTITGALVVAGGLGLGGNAFIGGTVYVSSASASNFSNLYVSSNTVSTTTSTGALVITGGLGLGGAAFIGGTTTHINSTSSSSTNSGSAVFNGGVGIIGNAFIGGTTSIINNTASISSNSGALVVTGGLGIGGAAFIGGTVYVPSSNTSNISNVLFTNGVVTSGSWSATAITGFYGGTGYNSYTTGDILVGVGNTFVKLNAGALNYVLTSAGTNTIPSWQPVSAAASSVQVQAATGTTTIYLTGVNTSVGSGLALTTISSISVNPATGYLSATGISSANIFTPGTNINFSDSTNGTGVAYAGGNARLAINFTTEATTGTAALYNLGGFLTAKNAFFTGTGSSVSILSTINSGAINTGAFVVTGGAAIGQSLSVGGRLQIFNGSNYAAFLFSGSANTTYTLPPASPAAIGTSVLSSTISGVMSWVPMAAGGSGSPAGSIGDIQLSNGLGAFTTLSSSYLNVNTTTGAFKHIGYNTTGTSNSSTVNAMTIGVEGISGFSGGAKGTILALDNTSGNAVTYNFIDAQYYNGVNPQKSVFLVDYLGRTTVSDLSIASNKYVGTRFSNTFITSNSQTGSTTYTLPLSSPAVGTSVLQSDLTGVMSWVPMVASTATGAGSGTVAIPGAQYQVAAYYSGAGASVSGSATFVNDLANSRVRITHTTPSTSVSTGAFVVDGSAGVAGSLFIGGQINQTFTPSIGAAIDHAVFLQSNPIQTNVGALIQIGSANKWDGSTAGYYTGTYGGTFIGINAASGNTADFINFQENGVSVFSVGAGGTSTRFGQTLGYTGTNVLASFVSTINSYNQLIIQNKSNGTNASADFVLNNDLSTDTTFYGNLGINSSTFSGSGAFAAPNATYLSATSGPLVLGTTTQHPIRIVMNGGATDMVYFSESGTAISFFANIGLRSQNDVRFWNAGNTNYTSIQASNNSATYTLSLPSAPVGSGASSLVIGADGNMYFVSPGGGIAFSTVTGNLPIIRAKRPLTLQFAAGFTPTAAGADSLVIRVPDNPSDGTSALTYVPREFYVRVETPSSGSSRIQLERSTGVGAFTLAATGSSYLGGLGLTIAGAGIYVTSTTSFAGAFITSGDNLRLNWTLLNATHANFSVQLLLEEV